MRALLALALVALLVAPVAAARAPALAYPSTIAELSGKIVDRVSPLAANASAASWWPDAQPWLDRAHADAAAGRFHATLYDAETFQEVVLAHRLQETTNASTTTVGDARSFVIQTATSWKKETNQTWGAFRGRLHQADGSLKSLGALETCLFAADLAAEAKSTDAPFDDYVASFAKQPDVAFDYLLVFVRLTKTPTLDIEVAGDVLEQGFAQDGVPPAIDQARWLNNTRVALAREDNPPPAHASFETLLAPARDDNESILAVALVLAEQRQDRFASMQTIFGDGASRGKNVISDADHGFRRQLNNTTLEPATSHGAAGLFYADAVDRAEYAQDVVDNGSATLAVVLSAWSGLDHAGYVTNVLADVSPVKPAPAKATPGFELPFVGLGLVAVALAARRRG